MDEVLIKSAPDDVPARAERGGRTLKKEPYGRKKTSVETGQHALPGAGGDGELRQ